MMPGMLHEREVLGSRVAGSHVTPRTTRFDRSLSVAGAAGLLALVLVGPVGLVVPAAILTAVAATAARRSASRRPDPPPSRRRTGGVPELEDTWRTWRVVEPDDEFLRGHAA